MILEQIVAAKKQEIRKLLSQLNRSQMEKEISALPPARNFQQALSDGNNVKLIAEIKHRSPTKGVLCKNFNHRRLAVIYRDHGAAAVSVLTDSPFFGGHLNYLPEVRQTIELPLLRKDFILDPLQVYQSRLFGADAILLIAALLKEEELSYLTNLARDCGLQTLVEVHTADELQWVLDLGINMIGINNRDLQSFQTDLAVTARLMELIKRPDITVVSESGIHSSQQMRFLQEQGVNAALVGEALVSSEDIPAKVRELVKGGGTVDGSVCTH
ncbi:indole-3-glycerol phosphate synthase TrpC [Desulforamulus aeronauticus]|uniref:Indole-3-glycerol phosphate synthase n=1 Tax=Desulforamulus aeronauticus DSM 10349 TaxID=1121421 RepID=A0A1M6R634_9FIRM|nr:indole-3-glycerol phosphate synthase TrpC [Desulforamulus aeronauticus]SHK27808.1 indole-3-glycerol phosphate synthase [Desulforamulus aeronauticus DSM 10349]